MRVALILLLAGAVTGCARRTAAPGLDTGSSAPVRVPPEQAAAITLPRSDAEWRAVGDEAARLLGEYLRINTTNPPGNEVAAARWLAEVLARDGITARVLEPAPGKANLVARLPGDGSARPIVLLSHMDVVLASAAHWSVPPFDGVVRDGAVWGRGALDMKGEGIAQLMTVLLLRRAGVPLKRDVILLATADEEINGGVGAGWVVERHPELVRDAEFLLNEGGETIADSLGVARQVGIGTTEKSPYWLDVTVRGPTGHGSKPLPENAVHRLIRALARIAAVETPLVVTPTVEAYFRGLAAVEPDAVRRRWYADIRAALADSAAVRALIADPVSNAMLRNTIAITGLWGSEKTNVIPPLARAAVDVRLLPDADPQAFLAELRRVVDDTTVTIALQGRTWEATESGMDTELYRAIVAAARVRYPEAAVVPYLLQGYTDSHWFRRLGIASYGIGPFPVTAVEDATVHGNDERLRLDALTTGVRFYFDVVHGVAAR
jgi:acetylornithine deacetylase/succinyl-diaminopimelate desuccinylase-like protein